MGQTWCRSSCLKEPHQANLWSPESACGYSSGLIHGRRTLGTWNCSHTGTFLLTLASTCWNLPVAMAFPTLYTPSYPILCSHCSSFAPTKPFRCSFFFTHQIMQSSFSRTDSRATEHPRHFPAPTFLVLTEKKKTQWPHSGSSATTKEAQRLGEPWEVSAWVGLGVWDRDWAEFSNTHSSTFQNEKQEPRFEPKDTWHFLPWQSLIQGWACELSRPIKISMDSLAQW